MRADGRGLHGARRVLVYGVTGSGKTTLAERLSRMVDIDWVSVDDLTWLPGWVPVPEAEQRLRFEGICAQDRWILDTAYGAWLDVVLPRTELVIALDYPRWRSLGRLLRRTVARNLDHRPVCNGNVESWRQTFSTDSIVAWHFRAFGRKRERIGRWEADPVMPPVLRVRTPGELETWLATVQHEIREAV